MEYYKAKDYQKAFEIWSQMTNDEIGLCNAGIILLNRQLDIPNWQATALDLFTKSSQMGYSRAKYYCGRIYERYYGKEYYLKAANYYFSALREGEQRAFDALIDLAEKGNTEAQSFTALCYHSGTGTERNREKAEEWAMRAYSEGEQAVSGHILGDIFKAKKEYSKSFAFYKGAAKEGNDLVFGTLGDYYRTGLGTSKNYAEALNWYIKGAKAGHDDARFFLGTMRLKGMGCKKNKKEAIQLFNQIAEGNQATPICWVGHLYFLGHEGLKDRSYGLKLLNKAAELGSPLAYARLGKIYFLGDHVTQDYDLSFRYLSKAPNESLAQEYLGLCHYFGKGCPKDVEKAKQYFKLAIHNGNENARKYLDSNYELTPTSKWTIKKEGAGVLGSIISAIFGSIISSIGNED